MNTITYINDTKRLLIYCFIKHTMCEKIRYQTVFDWLSCGYGRRTAKARHKHMYLLGAQCVRLPLFVIMCWMAFNLCNE